MMLKHWFLSLKRHSLILCLFLLVATPGCVNKRPATEEFNLARVALRGAKDSEAKRYAPKLYSKAKRYMRKAERSYKRKDFDKSEEYFRKSRYYSEKAENLSRLKMFKQGEMGI